MPSPRELTSAQGPLLGGIAYSSADAHERRWRPGDRAKRLLKDCYHGHIIVLLGGRGRRFAFLDSTATPRDAEGAMSGLSSETWAIWNLPRTFTPPASAALAF